MDDFAVDLDKVLDDFEESEDPRGKPTQAMDQQVADGIHAIDIKSNYPDPQHIMPYESPLERLDMDEANFAPSPPKSTFSFSPEEKISKDGGYFVPEDCGNDQMNTLQNGEYNGNMFGAMDDDSAVMNDSIEIYSSSPSDQHAPELLKDSNEAMNINKSSLSFISSSPPTHSQPDVVPHTVCNRVVTVNFAPCHHDNGMNSIDGSPPSYYDKPQPDQNQVEETNSPMLKNEQGRLSEQVHLERTNEVKPDEISDHAYDSLGSISSNQSDKNVNIEIGKSDNNVNKNNGIDLCNNENMTNTVSSVEDVDKSGVSNIHDVPTFTNSQPNICDNSDGHLTNGETANTDNEQASSMTVDQNVANEASSSCAQTSESNNSAIDENAEITEPANNVVREHVSTSDTIDVLPTPTHEQPIAVKEQLSIEDVLSNMETYDVQNEVEAEMEALIEEVKSSSVSATNNAPEVNKQSIESETSPEIKEGLDSRRSSSTSMDKYLAPAIMSPSIATPMEDAGFSKVPGLTPELSSMPEEEESEEVTQINIQDNSQASSNNTNGENVQVNENASGSTSQPFTGIGARPKEITPRNSRPNSLVGLSMPDLPPAVPVEPMPVSNQQLATSTVITSNEPIVNVNDVVNMQLAEQMGQAPVSTSNTQPTSTVITPQPNIQLSYDRPDVPLDSTTGPQNGQTGYTLTPSGFPDIPPPAYSVVAPDVAAPVGEPVVNGEHIPKQSRPSSLSLAPRGTPRNNQPVPYDDAMDASESSPVQNQQVTEGLEATESPPVAAQDPMAGLQFATPPLSSSNPTLLITELGKLAPEWVPDSEAPHCMQCEMRFTFTKRRHHCRACGKVFCNACCNLRSKLEYKDNREERVCSKCYQDLIRAQVFERMHPPTPGQASGQPRPNPNNPEEYCSTIPPMQQANPQAPPPTVMVPTGVLKREGSLRKSDGKQVMFSDGIRPGGDLTELDGSGSGVPSRIQQQKAMRKAKKVERNKERSANKTRSVKVTDKPSTSLIPDDGLPPLMTGSKTDFTTEENPTPDKIMTLLLNNKSEDPKPLVFAINKNLFVLLRVVTLNCCVNKTCWVFTTKGMCTVGQEEVVIVLECLPDERTVPRDIFVHFSTMYEEASKGNRVSHMGHNIFAQGFLDSKDHGGFLYIQSSFQCLQKLHLPDPPYVFGILLQKWEMPWAKVFPLRLMLRLGAEFRYYPCPLVGVRFRKPVFGEIGHTIMNLLADFRNYQYMLQTVRGVTIHMEEKQTHVNLPKNRYDDVMKVVGNSNDHVMAMGGNFSMDADSHLVCIQADDGNYQTQAINIQNKPRKTTGASFVVFNGALKTSSGLSAKSSIVEDGLMVQITVDAMQSLKDSMKDMQDHVIGCGNAESPDPEEIVIVRWVDDDKTVNIGVKSPIDNMVLDGVESVHIHNATDYIGESRTIRWTEAFFIQASQESSRVEPVDLSRLAETLAQAFSVALTPHLDKLKEAGLVKIGLRATIDAERVGYEVGSCGEKLPDMYMNDLDNELIPVIHGAASQNQDGPVVLELVFHVIES